MFFNQISRHVVYYVFKDIQLSLKTKNLGVSILIDKFMFTHLLFDKTLKTSDTTNNTIKIMKRIFAMYAASEEIPPKPKIPAIMAITRKITIQTNILFYITPREIK